MVLSTRPRFFYEILSVTRSLEVGDVTTSPCLGKHVKPLVWHLISLRSYQLAVPSDTESKGIGSALVFVRTFVHCNMFCTVGWSLELAAVAEIRPGRHHHHHHQPVDIHCWIYGYRPPPKNTSSLIYLCKDI